jgi:hypothetical protein
MILNSKLASLSCSQGQSALIGPKKNGQHGAMICNRQPPLFDRCAEPTIPDDIIALGDYCLIGDAISSPMRQSDILNCVRLHHTASR